MKKCQEIEAKLLTYIKKVRIGEYKHLNVSQSAKREIITDLEEKLKTWKKYVAELFDDKRQKPDLNRDGDESPEVAKQELTHSIKTSETGSRFGQITIEVALLKEICKTGIGTEELSTIVTIPKKAHIKECTDLIIRY